MVMYCNGCGRERGSDVNAADPGPCPNCQSAVRTSVPLSFMIEKFGWGWTTTGGEWKWGVAA